MIKLVDYFVVVGYDESSQHSQQHHSNHTQNSGGELDSFQENTNDRSLYKNGEHQIQAQGKIIQRFPTSSSSRENLNAEDHQEFDNNIHCFCQPDKGWRLYNKQEPPSFFVSVLTDVKVRLKKADLLRIYFIEVHLIKAWIKLNKAKSYKNAEIPLD